LQEELPLLRPLPPRRLESCKRVPVRVDRGSTIHVQGNTYSVASRLIGERVEARLYMERVEVWYGQRRVESLPRLRGRGKHRVEYRHVIDWLVRKPGAFADYRYRQELFPSSRFRWAYDVLSERQPERAAREYLAILHLAARRSESGVEAALMRLLESGKPPSVSAVEEELNRSDKTMSPTQVTVAVVDLASYDSLRTGKEADDDDGERRRTSPADGVLKGVAPAGLPVRRSEELARQAQQETLSDEQYLLGLAERECQERRQRRTERLLRDSRLPLEKSWASLELKRLPAKVVQQTRSLLEGSFVERRENVLVFGVPGSGKTPLLCALGQELVRSGRRVQFWATGLLVQELLLAKRDLKLSRVLKRLSGYEVLILDDLGYVQQSREEMEVLFTLLAERYERGSVLLTSNLPFSGWEAIFKDAMTTAAAIDSLVHHCVIVELNIASYRAEQAKKAKQGRSGSTVEEGGT
jgi:DNA replication protein DnaC